MSEADAGDLQTLGVGLLAQMFQRIKPVRRNDQAPGCNLRGVPLLFARMSTLAEIESAVESLPAVEKQELLLFLAARLRAEGGELPPPRRFTHEEMKAWIKEDEADMERFRRSA